MGETGPFDGYMAHEGRARVPDDRRSRCQLPSNGSRVGLVWGPPREARTMTQPGRWGRTWCAPPNGRGVVSPPSTDPVESPGTKHLFPVSESSLG